MRPVAASPGHLAPRSAPGPRRGTITTSSAMRARTTGAPERTAASRQRGGASGAPEGGVGGPEGAAAAAFRERAASSKERTARARESRTAAAFLLLLLMAASASIPPGASGRHTMSTTPPSSGLQVRPADPIDPADSVDPDHLADLIAPTAPPALTSTAEDDAWHQQHDSRLGWAPGVPGPLRRVLLRTERSLHGEKRSRLGKKGGRGRGGGGGRGRKAEQSCRLRVVQVTVRELGLGYDSDETLRFKYCGGSCRQDRNMYQMVLEHLLDLKGDLVASRSSAQPCCRPVGFEDVSFMDSSLEWKTLENVSANGCRCLR